MGIFGKPDDRPLETQASAPRPSPPSGLAATHAPATGPRGGSTSTCVIGAKIVIKGEISGDEDVVVEGTIEGQIKTNRDLRVAPGGQVKATVSVQSLVVSGEIIGDCEATNRIEIQSTGRLVGNIRAPKIVIAEGAMFRGNSDMSGRAERKDKVAGT